MIGGQGDLDDQPISQTVDPHRKNMGGLIASLDCGSVESALTLSTLEIGAVPIPDRSGGRKLSLEKS